MGPTHSYIDCDFIHSKHHSLPNPPILYDILHTFQKSALEKMGIWFRAQRFGNLVVFSMYKCIKKGFFDAVTGKTKAEVLAGIRASMTSNLAEIEEFDCLDLFGGLIFRQAKNNFDNEDEKNLS